MGAYTRMGAYTSMGAYIGGGGGLYMNDLLCWYNSNKQVCYIASVNTKRDWLICSHVALDK
jgi:hypothetical protein